MGNLASDASKDNTGHRERNTSLYQRERKLLFCYTLSVLTKKLLVFFPGAAEETFGRFVHQRGETAPLKPSQILLPRLWDHRLRLGSPFPGGGVLEHPRSSSHKAGLCFDMPGGFRMQGDRSTLLLNPWD